MIIVFVFVLIKVYFVAYYDKLGLLALCIGNLHNSWYLGYNEQVQTEKPARPNTEGLVELSQVRH